MADISVRSCVDQLVVSGYSDVDREEAPQIDDRVPAQCDSGREHHDARVDERRLERRTEFRQPPRQPVSGENAGYDDHPQEPQRSLVCNTCLTCFGSLEQGEAHFGQQEKNAELSSN